MQSVFVVARQREHSATAKLPEHSHAVIFLESNEKIEGVLLKCARHTWRKTAHASEKLHTRQLKYIRWRKEPSGRICVRRDVTTRRLPRPRQSQSIRCGVAPLCRGAGTGGARGSVPPLPLSRGCKFFGGANRKKVPFSLNFLFFAGKQKFFVKMCPFFDNKSAIFRK